MRKKTERPNEGKPRNPSEWVELEIKFKKTIAIASSISNPPDPDRFRPEINPHFTSRPKDVSAF